jgi:4,5-dihydroxyphthalate decarboxylase
MYINLDAKIEKPQDLKGRKIGVPEYQSESFASLLHNMRVIKYLPVTAAVWQRGIMEEEFGVPIESVNFFTGAIEPSEHERRSKIPHNLPPGVSVTQIRQGQNLSQMLADGEIDAIFSATKPSSFYNSSKVGYLFPNFTEVEAEYYQRTKIFPIMHVVALKRSVYDANPWIAKALTKAFSKALEIGYEPLEERAALRYMLPWLEHHVEETKRLMGGDARWWKDGFEENKHVLSKFLDYHFRQGLSKRRYEPEELFALPTLEAFVV